jgi:hypothetical protein
VSAIHHPRILADNAEQLHVHLKAVNLEADTVLPYITPTATKSVPLTLDRYLDVLDSQHYLQKVKIANPAAAEGHTIDWRWGQRQVEFSEKAAAKFIEEVMFEGVEDEAQPVARRGVRAAPAANAGPTVKEQKKKLMKNLERAVGSELTGEL